MRYLNLKLPLLLLGIAFSFAQSGTAKAESQDIIEYGKMCAAAIKSIPAFDCMEGTVIPITVNGKTPDRYYPDMDCDRPSLLNFGKGTDGQCTPFSRILNLSDGDRQVSALCRRKFIRDEFSTEFDEIDIVAHNVSDGSTCWFQATPAEGQTIDGSDVPSPDGETDPLRIKLTRSIWNPPQEVAKDGCGNCHDNDPFMHSPYIGQVWDQVPTNPFGWYKHLGPDFKEWKHVSISTRGNNCTSCHRLGTQFTGGQATEEAIGIFPIANANENARSYPLNHSMPVGNPYSLEQWKTIYQHSVDRITECHEDNNASGCIITPITGRPE
ncbi:hypothetical protein [Curvivirga aplysinae]|uniref:hypothetical protein n=1 Tax=Curvivirga aplysinae TaxID=2529852 RepID=UPI0012BC1C6F|nr:hypothetical protein [Curvivirga aplysinae]MTI08355.1 hypothetical protein [Curvivirga aplysinae]